MTSNIKTNSNDIKVIRVYEAPLNVVWEAWADPKKLAHWWGPRGFTITNHSKDLRVGGCWLFTMHGPDHVDYPNKTQYLEVEENALLVYDHGGVEGPPLFRVKVQFSKINENRTQMDMTMTLPTPEAAENTRKFVKKARGESTWDRLAEYLALETAGKEQFVINRSFDTKLKTMFDLWTDPKKLVQWLSPTGTSMKFFRADIKPGGGAFYMMSGAEGFKLYGKTNYLKVESPHRIVYSQQFCDENEKIIRHPMAPTWPETMLTIVTFAEEGVDKTRVTITWEADSSATPVEVATFVQGRAGMTEGWTGSFDKLEEYLSTL